MKKSIQYILIIAVIITALKHYGMGFLASFAALAFMIFFHELGHFLAARTCGVAVRRFSVGFGQVIYARRHGNTIYQIAAIPLGGFVKMKGESTSTSAINSANPQQSKSVSRFRKDNSYEGARLYKKLLILAAGPFANLLLGWLLCVIISFASVIDFAPVVGTSSNSALLSGDRLLQINDKTIQGFSQISALLQERNDIVLLRNGEQLRLNVRANLQTRPNLLGKNESVYVLGITSSNEQISYKLSAMDAIVHGSKKAAQLCKLLVQGVWMLISGEQSLKNINGIIAINDIASTAANTSWLQFLGISALISINLGIMNLLPIPVLDGGHIFSLLLGAVFGANFAKYWQKYSSYVGIALLAALMCLATFNDINSLIN